MTRKIVVPSAMLKTVHEFLWRKWGYHETNPSAMSTMDWSNTDDTVEVALGWLSEHPIVPTQDQANALAKKYHGQSPHGCTSQYVAAEWQRQMFLAPPPDLRREAALQVLSHMHINYPSEAAIQQVICDLDEFLTNWKAEKP